MAKEISKKNNRRRLAMELREKQLAMLNLLKRIDEICKKNNIEYCLAAGTVLGAVRHQGFIPWDDDTDIYMNVENYKKFEKVWKNSYRNDPSFFLQNYKTDKKYPMSFSKIRNTEIDVKEKYFENMGIKEGIWVDIFIAGYYSNNAFLKKIQNISFALGNFLIHKYFYITKNEYVKKHHNRVGIKAVLFRLVPDIIRKPLISLLLRLSYNSKKQNNIKNISYNLPLGDNYFDGLVYVSFEDTKMPIPKKYDKYLTEIYGDYMSPVKYQHDTIE